MTLPPIPPSVRTSFAGFLGATLGWVALFPGVPPAVAHACAMLSTLLLGSGLMFAADHRALKASARPCPICGYSPAGPPASPEPPPGGAPPAV
jgi:hypothetical protein